MKRLGIDIGSTTVKVAVIDEQHNILFSDYERHYANIQETLASLLRKAKDQIGDVTFAPTVTGSGGLSISSYLEIPFCQEVVCGGIQLIGRDDRSNARRLPLQKLMARIDKSKPVILLDHQPYQLAESQAAGIDLQFSGHTHHGQVWPMNWVTDHLYEQSHGYRQWENSHIYVSSGLSLWGPPFRIGTESEMVVLQLH